jgi:hypothetical protein
MPTGFRSLVTLVKPDPERANCTSNDGRNDMYWLCATPLYVSGLHLCAIAYWLIFLTAYPFPMSPSQHVFYGGEHGMLASLLGACNIRTAAKYPSLASISHVTQAHEPDSLCNMLLTKQQLS